MVNPQDPEDSLVSQEPPKNALTMAQVYLDWMRRDKEAAKVNQECIQLFEQIARKHLDDRIVHFTSRSIIDALKKEQVELKKDFENVRATLNPGDTARRDSVRFRMEKDSNKDGNTRD